MTRRVYIGQPCHLWLEAAPSVQADLDLEAGSLGKGVAISSAMSICCCWAMGLTQLVANSRAAKLDAVVRTGAASTSSQADWF